MPRAPFQVLVFPFIQSDRDIQYALFKRSDEDYWQGVAGGGEIGESIDEAALRETMEEASLFGGQLIHLQAMCMISVINISRFEWGPDVPVIPEYTFGYEVKPVQTIVISDEHDQFGWFSFEAAIALLKWDSNKTALWELDYRIQSGIAEIT